MAHPPPPSPSSAAKCQRSGLPCAEAALDSGLVRIIRWVPPGAVHDVSNPHLAPAVSIHAYSPPLSQMTFYRQSAAGLVATRTEHTNGPEREEAR